MSRDDRSPLKLNVIGAGKLGQTLARLWREAGLGPIGAILNQTEARGQRAVEFIGEGKAVSDVRQLPLSDLTLVASPDKSLATVAGLLSKHGVLKPGSTLFHCSGVLSSQVFSSLQSQGIFTASLHPMKSFAVPALSVKQFPGTYCGLEGDEVARRLLTASFSQMGAQVFELNPKSKALYHSAGAWGSNFIVTLAQLAIESLCESGVNEKEARLITMNLMQGTVANLADTLNPKASLTGPIQRGDEATVRKHLNALSKDKRMLYVELARASLGLSSLSEEDHAAMLGVLDTKF